MNIRNEQFSAGEVAEVLRINGSLLQNLMRRSGLEAPTVGGRRLFSAEAAARIAILTELNHYGMGPVQAGELVGLFMAETRHFSFDQWLRCEGLRGDEILLLRPSGGNSIEDVGRSGYTWALMKEGEPLSLGGKPSFLALGIGDLIHSVYRGLENIARQRVVGGRAV